MNKKEWLDQHPTLLKFSDFEIIIHGLIKDNIALDYDDVYGEQCVDLFRFYVMSVIGLKQQPAGVRGAKDFYLNYYADPIIRANFVLIDNYPAFIPQQGDVAFWDATPKNPYGHVAIETGNADVKEHEVIEQNYIKNKLGFRWDNYNSYLGVLRPKSLSKEAVNE